MNSYIMLLVTFNLLMLTDSSLKLKFSVSVLYHKLIAFPIKFIQLARVVLLSFLQLLKLLFQSDLHLGSILTILVKQVLQMLDNVLFRQIVNSIGLVHVKCISTVDNRILSHSQIKSSCHHQLVFWNWIFCSVLLQIIF